METTHPKIVKRQEKLKGVFLENVKKTPIIQLACGKTGISRSTFYRWSKDDTDFYQKYLDAENSGREYMNDAMESILIQKAKTGNMTAIIFYLKYNHPRYSDSFGALTPQDIKEVADYIENSKDHQNDFYFLSNLFRKRIPIKVGKYILNIMRRLSFIKVDDNEQKKIEILSKVIGKDY